VLLWNSRTDWSGVVKFWFERHPRCPLDEDPATEIDGHGLSNEILSDMEDPGGLARTEGTQDESPAFQKFHTGIEFIVF
jgi:hypothetical protein